MMSPFIFFFPVIEHVKAGLIYVQQNPWLDDPKPLSRDDLSLG